MSNTTTKLSDRKKREELQICGENIDVFFFFFLKWFWCFTGEE